ncbi:MAG: transporter substrate-binding protein [Clostridiaceae bacterium]|nr:transporter substrate-binding protein [Clostridiaceae bacterium]
MKFKRTIILFLIITACLNLTSCNSNKNKDKDKQKELNIYVDVKDKHSTNILKIIVEQFEEKNPKVKVNLTNALGSNLNEDISKKADKMDVIFTSRNSMIELARKGVLSDLSLQYDKEKISEKNYPIMSCYGRFNDKFYGIPLIPYTIEVACNTNELSKLKIPVPKNANELSSLIQTINSKGTRIPVILTDDLDIYEGLSSIVVNNMVNESKLESIYDSSSNAYKNVSEMQQAFNVINSLVSKSVINRNTFEIGNESTLSKLSRGDIPMAIFISYYDNVVENKGVEAIDYFSNLTSGKESIPVIVNALACMPVNVENGQEANDFIKFMVSDEAQKAILKKGFITGNKKANETNKNLLGTSTIKHLQIANENSVLYLDNLPKAIKQGVSSQLNNIIVGNSEKGKEWVTIVDQAYKK